MSAQEAIGPQWAQALTQWEMYLGQTNTKPSTISGHLRRIATLARTLGEPDPWQTSESILADWFYSQQLAAGYKASMRSTLRVFFTWAQRSGRMSVNPALGITTVQAGPTRRRPGSSGPLPAPVPAEWQGAVMAFCQWLAVAGKSPETIRLRRVHIEKLARDLTPLGPFDVTAYDISGWMYAQNWAAETRRANRATVRAFYAWAVNGGLIDYNPAENLPSVKAAHHLPRPASESQVKYAMTTADPRVKLMVCLGAELGLRRAEVAGVHTGDLIGEPGGDWSLLVRGKGDKERIVPLPAGLAQELRALPEGWAFPSRRGGHLTPGWVAVLVKRHLPAGVTMHALRHRFATRAYKVDRDVFAVQELLGHSSPNTTRRYVKVAEDTLRSTVQGLADNTTRRWVGVR